jgi:hypothetical protein
MSGGSYRLPAKPFFRKNPRLFFLQQGKTRLFVGHVAAARLTRPRDRA